MDKNLKIKAVPFSGYAPENVILKWRIFGKDFVFAQWKGLKPDPEIFQLLLLSDDKIGLKDWYLDDTNTVRQSVTNDEDYWSVRKDNKKIIAAYPLIEGVYTFPQDFIKDWCNNPVSEVNATCLPDGSILVGGDLKSTCEVYVSIPKKPTDSRIEIENNNLTFKEIISWWNNLEANEQLRLLGKHVLSTAIVQMMFEEENE